MHQARTREEEHVVSEVRRVAAPPATMSTRIWDIDWSATLPCDLGDGVTFEVASFDEAIPFIRDEYPRIFSNVNPDSRFLAEPMSEAKQRFGREMDTFLFRRGGEVVGLIVGHPTDWSSYYVRNYCVVPELQGRNIAPMGFARLVEPLRRAGVARVEGDVGPANIPSINAHLSAGFMPTGSNNSERWGSLIRFTLFLSEEAEAAFLLQHCGAAVRMAPKPKTDRRKQP